MWSLTKKRLLEEYSSRSEAVLKTFVAHETIETEFYNAWPHIQLFQ